MYLQMGVYLSHFHYRIVIQSNFSFYSDEYSFSDKLDVSVE